jgi:hypothetical protein
MLPVDETNKGFSKVNWISRKLFVNFTTFQLKSKYFMFAIEKGTISSFTTSLSIIEMLPGIIMLSENVTFNNP